MRRKANPRRRQPLDDASISDTFAYPFFPHYLDYLVSIVVFSARGSLRRAEHLGHEPGPCLRGERASSRSNDTGSAAQARLCSDWHVDPEASRSGFVLICQFLWA